MSKTLILADDLTGANDTGAAIRKHGWKTCSVIHDIKAPFSYEPYDCISVSLDSRHLQPEYAYRKIQEVFARFRSTPFAVYSKRIDSTLRGNLGAECDALLDSLADEETTAARIAMIVPAFPQAGRVYYNDTLFVNGTPLAQTAVAKDPHRPLLTSSALQLFREQSKYPCERIPLDCVRAGCDAITQCILSLVRSGYRNILFEAVTSEDIDLIAGAVLSSHIPFIAVDPGKFTESLTLALFGEGSEFCRPADTSISGKSALAVLGSCNQVAREQAEFFLKDPHVKYSVLDVAALLGSDEERDGQIHEAVAALSGDYPVSALVLSSVVGDILPVVQLAQQRQVDASLLFERINEAVAEAAKELLLSKRYGGVYMTGGDITVAICAALNTGGIEILDEILPLAVGGQITLEDHSQLFVATKGGMIGDPSATKACVSYLTDMVRIHKAERLTIKCQSPKQEESCELADARKRVQKPERPAGRSVNEN